MEKKTDRLDYDAKQWRHNATMQNRFLKLDIFSISILLDCLFVTDIGGSDLFHKTQDHRSKSFFRIHIRSKSLNFAREIIVTERR